MKLRRFISALLVFYLIFLQVEMAFGHKHATNHYQFQQEKTFITSGEESTCNACFAATLKPSICSVKAFFLPGIYVHSVSAYSFSKIPVHYSAWQNRFSDRAPPVNKS